MDSTMTPPWTLLHGDALDMLATLPAASVQCVVTSPPYYGLRDYGTAGQIGLEASPAEYVARLVAVFREVRRVLRDDGTVWLNVGDSYGSGEVGRHDGYNPTRTNGSGTKKPFGERNQRSRPSGFKPKDLIGIPWRLAFALQEPYYTGRIKAERDRVWLAAMIDAEGCMFIHKRKVGQNNGQGYERKSDTYGSGLEVANTSEAVVKRCLEIAGVGSICRQDKDRRQPLFRWNLRTNECREIVREVYPYLVAKQHQARLLIGCPSSGQNAEAAHAAMILLHGGGETTVDFPAPASMFEQGFYLRSDVIWNKLNPMPESVQDRCTRSHEYLFMLSKRATYFYDAAAIAEPGSKLAGTSHPFGNKVAAPRGVSALTGNMRPGVDYIVSGTRNKRSVWTISTTGYAGAHFATMPEKLVEPCILAGTSERGCCAACGAPWVRVVERQTSTAQRVGGDANWHKANQSNHRAGGYYDSQAMTTGWQPGCACQAGDPVPCVVLDPFVGSGTVPLVAARFNRRSIGIDLSAEYLRLAERRLMGQPMALPLEVS
jgi:DNA modification methylase